MNKLDPTEIMLNRPFAVHMRIPPRIESEIGEEMARVPTRRFTPVTRTSKRDATAIQLQVLAVMSGNPMSAWAIRDNSGLAESQVKAALSGLLTKGDVTRTNPGGKRAVYWAKVERK